MIDETKVRVMTRLAAYEEGAGKKHMPIGNYFRTDYICLQLLESFVCGTFAFLAILGIMLFYNFEVIMGDIYNVDLMEMAKGMGKKYIICMGVYLLLTYIYSAYRYSRAQKSLKSYNSVLGKLKKYGDLVEVTGQGWVTKKGDVKIDTIAATVDEAVAAGLLLDKNMTSKAVYVVTGYVDSIVSAYSEQYGNMSFYMCDDISNPKYEFEGFQITVPKDDQPKVGDKVMITGNLLHYYKAATETAAEQNVIEIKKGDFQLLHHAAIENVRTEDMQNAKMIRNGRLYIIREGRKFNAMGMEMK